MINFAIDKNKKETIRKSVKKVLKHLQQKLWTKPERYYKIQITDNTYLKPISELD